MPHTLLHHDPLRARLPHHKVQAHPPCWLSCSPPPNRMTDPICPDPKLNLTKWFPSLSGGRQPFIVLLGAWFWIPNLKPVGPVVDTKKAYRLLAFCALQEASCICLSSGGGGGSHPHRSRRGGGGAANWLSWGCLAATGQNLLLRWWGVCAAIPAHPHLSKTRRSTCIIGKPLSHVAGLRVSLPPRSDLVAADGAGRDFNTFLRGFHLSDRWTPRFVERCTCLQAPQSGAQRQVVCRLPK